MKDFNEASLFRKGSHQKYTVFVKLGVLHLSAVCNSLQGNLMGLKERRQRNRDGS